MKTVLFAAVAALSLAIAPAFAAEGNGDPFPSQDIGAPVANLPTLDVGAAQLPSFAAAAYGPVAVTEGGVLPPSANEASVESGNSLPRR